MIGLKERRKQTPATVAAPDFEADAEVQALRAEKRWLHDARWQVEAIIRADRPPAHNVLAPICERVPDLKAFHHLSNQHPLRGSLRRCAEEVERVNLAAFQAWLLDLEQLTEQLIARVNEKLSVAAAEAVKPAWHA